MVSSLIKFSAISRVANVTLTDPLNLLLSVTLSGK